jgi:hypothetical protein
MKRIVYISIAVFVLGLASCSKQEIKPNSSNSEVPVWKSNKDITDPELGGTDGGDPITDPNTDPELETAGS